MITESRLAVGVVSRLLAAIDAGAEDERTAAAVDNAREFIARYTTRPLKISEAVNVRRALTGAEFRRLRHYLGWSQRMAADVLAVSSNSVCRWESGARQFPSIAGTMLRAFAARRLGSDEPVINLMLRLNALKKTDDTGRRICS